MVDIVLKFTNDPAMTNRLRSLGIIERPVPEEGGRTPEERFGNCNTDVSVDGETGEKYIMIRLEPSDADKLPPDNNPAFALVWRSDDYTYSGMVDVVSYIDHEPVLDEFGEVVTAGYRETIVTPTYMENVQHPLPTFSVKEYNMDVWLGTYRQQTVGAIA